MRLRETKGMALESWNMEVEVLGPWMTAPAEGMAGACSSYVVSGGSTVLLLDCGPGTLQRLQQRDLTRRLDAIVISQEGM